MDDADHAGPEPDDDEGGSARPASGRRRAVRKTSQPVGTGTSRSSASAGGPANGGRPRRWWEQPWLWGIVLVGVIGGAVGVSLLVNTDPDDITPTGDTTAFCATIRSYRDVRDANDAKGNAAGTDADDAALRAALVAVQQASPSEIRSTTDELLAALDQVTAVQRDNRTASTALDATAAASAKLAAIDSGVKHASVRFANYTQKACGIDLATSAPDTTPPVGTSPGGSVPATTVPDASASLVTPP